MISSALVTGTFYYYPYGRENAPLPTRVTFSCFYRTVDRLPLIVLQESKLCYLGHSIMPGTQVFKLGRDQYSCMLHGPPTFKQLTTHFKSHPNYSNVEIRKMSIA